MIIKNGIINDSVNRESYVSDILICDGKIKEIKQRNFSETNRKL